MVSYTQTKKLGPEIIMLLNCKQEVILKKKIFLYDDVICNRKKFIRQRKNMLVTFFPGMLHLRQFV